MIAIENLRSIFEGRTAGKGRGSRREGAPARARAGVFFPPLLGLLAIAASPLGAQAPSIANLTPRGAERGKALTLIVEGANLLPDPELLASFGSPWALVTEEALKPQAGRLAYRLELGASEAPGPRVLRVRTPKGLSNPVIFMVGTLPEAAEEEANDTPPQAKPITLPVVMNGRLSPTDRDTFRFSAREGERLVFEVEARRLGSAVDPTLRLLRLDGGELALSEDAYGLDVDARIDYRFAAAGEYLVQVHDAMYAARAPDFYRLRAGALPYPESVFPLGGRAGSEVEVVFEGGNLEGPVASRVRLDSVPLGRWAQASLPPALDGGAGVPFPLRAGALPETFEGKREKADAVLPLLPGTTLNGRLEANGEVDRYVLDVAPGQNWAFDVEAAALGSWLDAILSVHDEKGNRLALVDDAGGPDPRLDFAVPAGLTKLILAIEDLHRRGGKAYGYRLTAAPARPDFTLKLNTPQAGLPLKGTALLEVECARRGGVGTVQLFVPSPPAGYTVRGGEILPDQTKGYLTITGPEAAAVRALQIEVLGTAGTPAEPLLRRAETTVFLASDQNVPVAPLRQAWAAAAVVEPRPLALRAEVESVDVVLGQGLAVPVEAVRAAGADGEIKLTGVSAPPGITVQEGKIPAGQTKGAVTLAAAANAALRAGDVVINASLKSGGGDLTAPAPVIRARVVEPFSVALGGAAGGGGGVLKAARGGKIALEGKVARASPFAGQVDLKVEGLPAGVAAAAANVAPDKTDFSLEISVDAAVAVGEVELKLVASAPLGDPKQPVVHAVPPVVFRLAIGEEAAK